MVDLCKKEKPVRFRIKGLYKTEQVQIKDIRAEHVSKLIQVEGLVRRSSEVKPEIKIASFECPKCGNIMKIEQLGPNFRKPSICDNPACGRNGPFDLLDTSSSYNNWQNQKIQEKPENLKGGQLPRSLDCVFRDDIVEKSQPGNIITLVGVIKTVQEIIKGAKQTTFNKYLDVISLDIKQKDVEDIEISDEEKEEFLEMAEDKDLYIKIAESIAPSIFGHMDLKKAIALQLFSGKMKVLPDGTKRRGDSNILIVGDPGLAKSQILKYVNNLAYRSIYTSGKGTSAAGLTAAVVKDEFSGGWALEAGALVIADQGYAMIDEIDKMSKEDRSSLHEALEQGTVSIAKAGIMATLNTRVSVLAAANPKFGRFDINTPLIDQLELGPALLSRFDLIFLMLDTPKKEKDSNIASHVLKVHGDPGSIKPKIEVEKLRKYIVFAKDNIKEVKISEEGNMYLLEYYVGLRDTAARNNQPLPITVRQLESLIRLSESRARLNLRTIATISDVKEVIQLYEETIKKVGEDSETKTIDIDQVMGGAPRSQQDKARKILEIIKRLDLANNKNGVESQAIYDEATKENISLEYTRKLIEALKKDIMIFEPKPGILKPTYGD